jgi:hypothetical protein
VAGLVLVSRYAMSSLQATTIFSIGSSLGEILSASANEPFPIFRTVIGVSAPAAAGLADVIIPGKGDLFLVKLSLALANLVGDGEQVANAVLAAGRDL